MSLEFRDFTNLASTTSTVCLYQPNSTKSQFYYLQIIDIAFKLRDFSGKYRYTGLQATCITVSRVHLLSYGPTCSGSAESNHAISYGTSSYNLNHHYIVQCNNE